MARNTKLEVGKPWRIIGAPLALALLLMPLVGYFVPVIPNNAKSVFSGVNSVQLRQVVIIISLTAVTTIFLAYYRTKFYFSKQWLFAAAIYNALVVFVKFTLSTYQYSIREAASLSSALSAALLVSLLYVIVLSILFMFFDGRILSRKLHKAIILTRDGKVLLAMGLFVCATLARVIIFSLPILSGSTTSSYLSEIFKSNAALLNGLIFVMILAAVEAFAQVRRRSDLKYFFVTGILLILSFHLTWAIFIFRSYGNG